MKQCHSAQGINMVLRKLEATASLVPPKHTTAFCGAKMFNRAISTWDVSSVPTMQWSTSFLANC